MELESTIGGKPREEASELAATTAESLVSR
jgi:hypothetical protein